MAHERKQPLRAAHRYLPVSARQVDWGIYVTSAGFASVPPGSAYPPVRHPETYHFKWESGRVLPEYACVYITSGRGVFESRPTGKCRVRAGNMILLFPGVWHRYAAARQTGWDEYWVTFNGAAVDALVGKGLFTPDCPVLAPGFDQRLLDLYQGILDRVNAQSAGYEPVIAAMALQILAQTWALLRAPARDASLADRVVRDARRRMAERTDASLVMNELAARLHVGYSWFRHAFKRQTGLSPHQYRLQLRIDRAKNLLTATDDSVKTIATALGFASAYYFSRVFRRKVGASPTRWRAYSRGETA